ncbi:hypothetical protein NHH03_18495 [Stieleria sp. TO1_6]|uniref:hypothetical protein n=1 Tax=Stieleria tagensis TaxID=2956795 RepID=UPI00209AA2F8|nr:hypothetical protein [Stieleria tagensis]MCO8123742.1 hypothetical protein [Stieleria tagensis]
MISFRGVVCFLLFFSSLIISVLTDVGNGLIDHGDAGHYLRKNSGPVLRHYSNGQLVSEERIGYTAPTPKRMSPAKTSSNPFVK